MDGQFETYLVIALAGSTVNNSIRAFPSSNLYQLLGDEGRAKEVPSRYFFS
jgi:hypothetical protein